MNRTGTADALRPRHEPAAIALGPAADAGDVSRFAVYGAIIFRFRWQILGLVLAGTVLVFLFAISRARQFASTAIIQVDASGSRVVGDADVERASDANTDALISTAEQLLVSSSVQEATLRDLHLNRNPEFNPTGKEGDEAVLRNFRRAVSVDRPPGSLLLEISARTHYPQLSADIANSIANEFLNQQYTSRAQAINASSSYMSGQLDEMRKRMEDSQAALVKYQIDNDVLDPDDKTNIMRARLKEINDDLSTAESDRMKIQAVYEVARNGDVDALALTAQGASLLPFLTQMHRDQQRLAEMSQIYGTANPIYRQQQNLIATDRIALDTEAEHVQRAAEANFLAAINRERLITGSLQQQKQAMDAFDLRAVRYGILDAEAESNSKLYYDLLQRIKEADVAANFRAGNIRLVNRAEPRYLQVYPRPLLYSAIAGLLLSLVGIGGAVLYVTLDRTIASAEQIETWFGLNLLAGVPEISRGLQPESNPRGNRPEELGPGNRSAPDYRASPYTEAIASLRSALLLSSTPVGIVAVASSVPGEGKSSTSVALASALVQIGHSTVIIDADLRKPRVHELLGLSNRAGLAEFLRHAATPDEILQTVPSLPRLAVVTAGGYVAAPAELLHAGLASLLEQLRDRYEHIIIDCPPILGFADAVEIASVAESLLLVISAGHTDRNLITEALRKLRNVRAVIGGVVLNRISTKLHSYYGYYGEKYAGYYRSDE